MPSDAFWTVVLVQAVVFGASFFQAVTGLGLALIAGPFLLLVLSDGGAVQISIILNLVTACILAPMLLPHCDRKLLVSLGTGGLAGIPAGILLFGSVDVSFLKAAIGGVLVVLGVLTIIGKGAHAATSGSTGRGSFAAGAIAGFMSSFMAMPGPPLAAYFGMSRSASPEVLRATVLALFVLFYGASLGCHVFIQGIQPDVVEGSLLLMPATLAGMAIGLISGLKLNAQTTRIVLAAILLLSAAGLFTTV